jgi:hypothetical protein
LHGAELLEERCGVRADPFLCDQAVGEAIELVARVPDRAACWAAEVLAVVGAVEGQPHSNAIFGRDEVIDVDAKVGERRLDQRGTVPPSLGSVEWLGQIRKCMPNPMTITRLRSSAFSGCGVRRQRRALG